MIFYVLLTCGPRPSGSIHTHPAAKAQLRFIKKAVSSHPSIKASINSDYARRIDHLDSLPNLKKVLMGVSGSDGVKVRVDDLSRIFRVTKSSVRQKLLADLQEFGTSLYSIKHKKALAEFSPDQIRDLLIHPEKSKLPARPERSRDTSKARRSSSISRSCKSQSVAKQLKSIKNEIEERRGRVTLQMVADEANARSVSTTRGNDWSPQNVARMLKSLE